MHLNRRSFLYLSGAAVATGMISPGSLMAAAWPGKNITCVVGYGAGGGVDAVARALTPGMQAFWPGSTLNVINQPGATASKATGFVFNKPSDGYWWLFTSNYNMALRVQDMSSLTPWKDWQFYRCVATLMSFSVPVDSPFQTIADVVEAARKNPGTVSISNSGVGGTWNLGTMALERVTGVKFRHMPYSGGDKATLAGLQGEVQVVGSGIHEQISYLRAEKLRHLCIFQDEPLSIGSLKLKPITDSIPEAAPECPNGGGATLGIRRDTPVEILREVEKAFLKAQENPRYKEMLTQKGIVQLPRTGEAADRDAARHESVTAWALHELGQSKVNPADLGIPKPENFEAWWPPKEYKRLL